VTEATTATTTMGAKKKTHLNLPPLIKRDLILKEIQYELDLEIIELPMHQQHINKNNTQV